MACSPRPPATPKAPRPGGIAERPGTSLPLEHAGLAFLGFSITTVLAFADGGYFESSWRLGSIALLALAGIVLLVRERFELGRAEASMLAAGALLILWIALSISWSIEPALSVREVERGLLYLSGLLVLIFATTERNSASLVVGVLAGVTTAAAYGLFTYLVPRGAAAVDPFQGRLLYEPIGYANALGILAVIGAILGLGLATRAPGRLARALGGASLVVLLPTLYFTSGRGAWVALAIGLLAAAALDPQRLGLLGAIAILAPAPVVAVWLGSRSERAGGIPPAEVASTDRQLAATLLALALANACCALLLSRAERRVRLSFSLRRLLVVGVLAVVLTGLGLLFARIGDPVSAARSAYSEFQARPAWTAGDFNRRLFSLSAGLRPDLWRVAWEGYEAHPWGGTGAGTYERQWLEARAQPFPVRDAHSIYLEALAELGPVGIALLLALLASPFAALRARRQPLVSLTLAAYLAYLVHAAADWDWEMPVVTFAALACGVQALAAARPIGRSIVLGSRTRAVLLVLVLFLGIAAAVRYVSASPPAL